MLPFVLVNALGATLFILGWAISRRVVVRHRRTVQIGACLILLLVVAKSALNHLPVAEATLFPFTWYAWIQDYVLIALGLLFFGWAIPLLPVRWNQAAVAVVAAVLLGRGLWATQWMVAPLVDGQERGADAQHQCRQSTDHTCGPSACVEALSYVGIAATEREMVGLCLTNGGTTDFNLFRGLTLKLEGSPWRARLASLTAEELVQRDRLAVCGWATANHAIAVHGDGSGLVVHDPLHAQPDHWDLAMVKEYLDGVAVVIEPR